MKRRERAIALVCREQRKSASGDSRDETLYGGGAILADDMGLGKTVDCIALVASTWTSACRWEASVSGGNERIVGDPQKGGSRGRVRCGATLIVMPLCLLDQWRAQIERHAAAPARVFVYHGSTRQRALAAVLSRDARAEEKVRPRSEYGGTDAAKQQSREEGSCGPAFVLTTYEVLRYEHEHVAAAEPRVSPEAERKGLYGVEWYRVILDEAHRIRIETGLCHRSALAIRSQRRWCVTGTPYNNACGDLRALAKFVGVAPYDRGAWWDEALASREHVSPSFARGQGIHRDRSSDSQCMQMRIWTPAQRSSDSAHDGSHSGIAMQQSHCRSVSLVCRNNRLALEHTGGSGGTQAMDRLCGAGEGDHVQRATSPSERNARGRDPTHDRHCSRTTTDAQQLPLDGLDGGGAGAHQEPNRARACRALQSWVDRFVLMRDKAQVASHLLPICHRRTIRIALDHDERLFYDTMLRAAARAYSSFAATPARDRARRSMLGAVLAWVGRLRQACNHPLLAAHVRVRLCARNRLSDRAAVQLIDRDDDDNNNNRGTDSKNNSGNKRKRANNARRHHEQCRCCARVLDGSPGGGVGQLVECGHPLCDHCAPHRPAGPWSWCSASNSCVGTSNGTSDDPEKGRGGVPLTAAKKPPRVHARRRRCPPCNATRRWGHRRVCGSPAAFQSSGVERSLSTSDSRDDQDGKADDSDGDGAGDKGKSNGQDDAPRGAESGKMRALVAYCREALAADPTSRIVVFSQWTSTLDMAGVFLQASGMDSVRYDGGITSASRRASILASFIASIGDTPSPDAVWCGNTVGGVVDCDNGQDRSGPVHSGSGDGSNPLDGTGKDRDGGQCAAYGMRLRSGRCVGRESAGANKGHGNARILLASLHCAGVGLDLSAANHVVLIDAWYNPFIEQQACDRVYRIGQTRPVHIVRLRTIGTVEADVVRIQMRKMAEAQSLGVGRAQAMVKRALSTTGADINSNDNNDDESALDEADLHEIFRRVMRRCRIVPAAGHPEAPSSKEHVTFIGKRKRPNGGRCAPPLGS